MILFIKIARFCLDRQFLLTIIRLADSFRSVNTYDMWHRMLLRSNLFTLALMEQMKQKSFDRTLFWFICNCADISFIHAQAKIKFGQCLHYFIRLSQFSYYLYRSTFSNLNIDISMKNTVFNICSSNNFIWLEWNNKRTFVDRKRAILEYSVET